MPLVMGVESSSPATVVEVRDSDDGTLVATGRAPHPEARPPRSEQDPGDWWDALVAAVAAAGVRDVAALSVAAQPHGLVALDAAGAVLRPAKLGDDTEAAAAAARMVERLGAARWAKACGSVPDAGFTIAKLAWLSRAEPRAYEHLGTVLAPHDLLTYRLTGRLVTDRGDASASGCWSPAEGRWRPDLLDGAVGRHPNGPWSAKLPEVLGPDDPSDWVSASQNHQLGLRGRPLCGPGTGAPMASALAVALDVGDVLLSVGPTGSVSAVSERPTADASGAVRGYADGTGRFLPTVVTGDAARATDAVARVLGVDGTGLDELALRSTPGAGGLVLLPQVPGSLHGLHHEVTREQVARAAVEGVVCSLLEGVAALGRAGVATDGRVLLVGPAASSAAYRRVAADLAGREVVVPESAAHAASGACVQAAAVLAGVSPGTVAAEWGLGVGDVVEPSGTVDRRAVLAAHAAARRG